MESPSQGFLNCIVIYLVVVQQNKNYRLTNKILQIATPLHFFILQTCTCLTKLLVECMVLFPQAVRIKSNRYETYSINSVAAVSAEAGSKTEAGHMS